ncbi:hypothetical protein FRC00_013128 [Tulasnella sp. 408]|nr:hypothetical protein FRC00_013128 [Tulasnella sp. 408]
MPDCTSGLITGSSKRKSPPEEIDEMYKSSREPKRLKLSLRAVVEALSKWRMHAEDLVFSNDSEQKRGGSADITKATASSHRPDDPDGGSSFGSVQTVAVKKFRFGGGVGKRAEVAVRFFRHVPEPYLFG